MFWAILIIAILVLGSIAWIFDVGFWGALGIVVLIVIAFAVTVHFVNKLSSKHPKFGSFLSRSGKKASAIMFFGGLVTAVISFFIDAGSEVRSYTNYSGGTNYYVADAVSVFLAIGILVAFVGAVMFISCFLINEDSTKQESNKEKGASSSNEVIYFGKYYIDKNAEYKEPIKWIVLEKKFGQLLLMSEKVLDVHNYNQEDSPVKWQDCGLRKWLNETFLNTAFTEEERNKIILSPIPNPQNPTYIIDGGAFTTDKVYVLSIDEYNKFIKNTSFAKAKATVYAENKNLVTFNDNCCWWLRTPGGKGRGCFAVYDGHYSTLGGEGMMTHKVYRKGENEAQIITQYPVGVRPVIRIKK